ncbi:MAG: aminopeptidase N [Legionellales bacterium]|nr:aminopeptidase N [Legionellales bacterium]
MSTKTIYLKDYQPPMFEILKVALNFDLYDAHVLVTTEAKYHRLTPGDLHLYGDELELVSVQLNHNMLEAPAYGLEGGDLIIPGLADEFTLTIVTRIYPQNNTKLAGLFRSNHLFCTQCESHGFRRMTYFLDRPDVLTTFTTRITADKLKYPVLLSNGNLKAQGVSQDGRHWALWEDPFKKPSYLFALVAGSLAQVSSKFVTASGRTVDLHIYVEHGNEDKCAHAMDSLKKAMRWDEEAFGREYDLDIFMLVAVSDFNMGAMENKGLNIFNSKYVLARPDTATDQDYADIEGVVGHEYFHNWTGDRVTCRDWFQLSLKEGLTVFRDQEFSCDMNSRDVCRIMDVRTLRNTQFPEDAGSMAHPVRPESYQEINNFYTATIYNKGAEVIRMQQAILGKVGFRLGMDLYFKRHDGQAVTIDNFVSAMEDANAVDFTQFKRWYSQAGTPEVQVVSHYHDGTLSLSMIQSCPSTPDQKDKKPFHIPIRVALFDSQGHEIPIVEHVLELQDVEQTFRFDKLPEKPIVSLLRDFSAPIHLTYAVPDEELLALFRFETNGFARWEAGQRLALERIKLGYQTKQKSPATALIGAYRQILGDEGLDADLRAELITPPSFEDVALTLTHVDVFLLLDARDAFCIEVGQSLFSEAMACYQSLDALEDHAMNAAAYARRKLRNVCLRMMMKADEERALPQCQHQFAHAKTMTCQIAGFAMLVNCKRPEVREQAIDAFYQQWQGNDLVLDKWFAVQASSDLPGTLGSVKKLLHHPAFNIKNPNKVRALVGAFTQMNPRAFHAIDGSGYEFLKDILVTMDTLNPQIAARLATPFTRWQRLNELRQGLMRQQLESLSKLNLSKDMRELVAKSLVT